MKRKLVLFIAQSIDGYIATKSESLDWLDQVAGEGDNGYSAFYEKVDTILMGRKTYDWVMKATNNELPYKDKACFVFSKATHKETADVNFINQDLSSFIRKLKEQDGKNIWAVGGGELVSALLQEKLIDEMILTIAPTLLGSGIPLFKESPDMIEWKLKGVQTFNQFVEVHYVLKKGH